MAVHWQAKTNEDKDPATLDLIRQPLGRRTLLIYLVNLCNVSAAREFDDCSSPPTRGIWLHKNVDAQ
jgi:hypothetical protein